MQNRFLLHLLCSTMVLKSVFGSTSTKHVRDTSIPFRVQAGDQTEILGLEKNQPLPLGVPVEFETPLFKGSILMRFRNAKSEDPHSHQEYFRGRKRLMQTVVQGYFKKPVKMSEVYVGSVFQKPFPKGPPPSWVKIMDAVIRRIAPGLILDLASNQPKVIALYAGTAQTMSINKAGSEPNIMAPDLPEDVTSHFGDKFKSPDKRKKTLSIPDKAAQYVFDTEHVYTFHNYDDAVDYSKGTIRLPIYGDYDIKPAIGAQPMPLCAVTSDGEVLYSFNIMHDGIEIEKPQVFTRQ